MSGKKQKLKCLTLARPFVLFWFRCVNGKNLLSTIPQSDDTKAVAIDSSYCQRCFLIMSKENQMYTGY